MDLTQFISTPAPNFISREAALQHFLNCDPRYDLNDVESMLQRGKIAIGVPSLEVGQFTKNIEGQFHIFSRHETTNSEDQED